MSLTDLSQEDRLSLAIEQALDTADRQGRLTEDDAGAIAEQWTTDDIEGDDDQAEDDDTSDLNVILVGLNERFGF